MTMTNDYDYDYVSMGDRHSLITILWVLDWVELWIYQSIFKHTSFFACFHYSMYTGWARESPADYNRMIPSRISLLRCFESKGNESECKWNRVESNPGPSGLVSQHYTNWAKESWAIYWQAHAYYIVSRGARIPPIYCLFLSSSIGLILPAARLRPTWLSHHFIPSF